LPDILDISRAVDGTFGSLYLDGNWETNVTEVTADVNFEWSELRVCGTRWTQNKLIGVKGTGSITGFKVTSKLQQLNMPMTNDRRKSVRTELITKINDPESYGFERMRLKNVKFDKIPLGWKVGEVIQEEWPFRFEGIEPLDYIEED
jgi:hypothetical protein